jgi:hypothetical protein
MNGRIGHIPPCLSKLQVLHATCACYTMPCNHLLTRSNLFPSDMFEFLTVFVLLLNTRTFPVEVPTNMCLPDGSNRAVVMMELAYLISSYRKAGNQVAYRARSSSPSLKPSHSSTLARCSLRESTTYASPVLSKASTMRLRLHLSSAYDKIGKEPTRTYFVDENMH